MYNEFDIYSKFRKVQAETNNRGYRLPKDWVTFYTEKLTVKQQEILTRISKYFSSVWCDIDIEKYFECGFELYPKFSYHHFFDKKIMLMYKQRDKIKKNDLRNMKRELIDSTKYVLSKMKDKPCRNKLISYCLLRNEQRHIIIEDYMKNKISGYFLVWMIAEGFFDCVYDYKSYISFVDNNYRTMYNKLYENYEFLKKIKEKCNGEI